MRFRKIIMKMFIKCLLLPISIIDDWVSPSVSKNSLSRNSYSLIKWIDNTVESTMFLKTVSTVTALEDFGSPRIAENKSQINYQWIISKCTFIGVSKLQPRKADVLWQFKSRRRRNRTSCSFHLFLLGLLKPLPLGGFSAFLEFSQTL